MTNEPTQSDSQPEAPASDQPADIDTWDPPADARIVATVDSTFAAKALVAVLADHDINAAAVTHLQQGASIHPGGADYPVRIVVAPSDADRARTVLEDNARDAAQINWDDLEMDEVTEAAPPGGIPIVARLGLYAAIAIIFLMIVMAIVMLVL